MKRRTSTDMFPVIKKYLDRDCTQAEFVDHYGVSSAVLYYWLKRYRESNDKKADFIGLNIERTTNKLEVIKIQCPNGLTLEIPFI